MRMRWAKAIIPNALTMLCMFFGFASVTQSLHGKYLLAAWLLAPSAFLDLFDGAVAKALNASSEFGREFDSFSDLVTFGFAPSILIYGLFLAPWGVWGIIISFLPLVGSALRLTRYNLRQTQFGSEYFTGLPAPANAGMLAGFVALTNGTNNNPLFPPFVAGMAILVAVLMVSLIPFVSNAAYAPNRVLRNWKGYTLIAFFPALILFPRVAFFLWTSGLIVYSLTRWGYLQVSTNRRSDATQRSRTPLASQQ